MMAYRAITGRGGMAEDELSVKAIAARLRLTREALGLKQTEFCGAAGIATNAYNNWERGRARPQVEQAIALCRAHKISLDWIYMGDPSGLRYDVASAITALRKVRS